MHSLVFILGPTASGKTAWALQWAEQNSSCIINGDSIQAYKDLKIGSAKPSFKNQPSLTHYLFDEISAPQVWTAGDFRRKALEVLKKELPVKTVFVVGGSGFYIQALENGMYRAKVLDPKIMDRWKQTEKDKGLSCLYDLLKKQDPKTAEKISSKDRYRIFRSLSLIESEGKTISQIKKEFTEKKLPWPYLKVALNIPKKELLKRVERRTQKMIKEGLIEEIEQLLDKGFQDWRPLNSVGYKEGRLYLEGKIKKEDLVSAIVSSTMSLAKKQKTWFKRDKSIKWFDFDKPALAVYKEIFK